MRITGDSFWAWAQGLGLGLLFGVILASGLGFDSEDTARFIGALVGALIAVTGAVSLHYLKEANAVSERRNLIAKSIGQLHRFNAGLLDNIADNRGVEISSGLRVTQRFLGRVKRQCQAYEAVDGPISVALGLLENIKEDSYVKFLKEDNEYADDDLSTMRLIFDKLGNSFKTAIFYIEQGID